MFLDILVNRFVVFPINKIMELEMERKNDTTNVVKATTTVGVAKTSDTDIRSIWEKNVDKRSRGGTMMIFEDFRMSLGGADSHWGTKVFYKTCIDLGILKKCDGSSSHCPTIKVIEKYPNLFFYDEPTMQWGIASGELDDWNDNILPHIVVHAQKVREQFAEVKKIKAKARYYENKNVTKELF